MLPNGFDADSSFRQVITGCFAAGTPSLTPHGPVPIGTLRPGDWVATQQLAGGDELCCADGGWVRLDAVEGPAERVSYYGG